MMNMNILEVVTLPSIYHINNNYSYFIGFTVDNSNCAIALRNREGKFFYNAVRFILVHAHYPNKIFNIININLMCISYKDNHATPWAGTLLDPNIL